MNLNLSKNVLIALLGLACYVKANHIDLANNATIGVIILALLLKNQTPNNEIFMPNNMPNNYPPFY